MAFVEEDIPAAGSTELAVEHRSLVGWMTASRVGVPEYLRHRMVDPELRAALYYIEGLGMGDGQRFALVRGNAIYLVSVYRDKRSAGNLGGRVADVSVPEFAPMSRGAIQSLLDDALRDYYEAHPYMMRWAVSANKEAAELDWRGARWDVRPRQYSMLYWRTRCGRAWQGFRARYWPRVWRTLTSPLVAALSLTASALTTGGWLVALCGAWLALRMLQYETDWRLGAWMIGQLRYRHPLGHLYPLGRSMNPQPLEALKVRVEPLQGQPMMRIVRVVNRSWVPVPYVSVGSHSLAQMLAPGLIELLRRQGAQRVIDGKELERHFPGMVKKWLWPGQSFACRHHLLADFPHSLRPPPVEAVVSVSRFVSGERRSGPATFLLDVENVA
jgi:hypothetical protein